jgi:hypothetical protein
VLIETVAAFKTLISGSIDMAIEIN